MRSPRFIPVLFLLFLLACSPLSQPAASNSQETTNAADGKACPQTGQWLNPATGQPLKSDGLIRSLAVKRVVLLGETHNDRDHHRWQLHTLSALYGQQPHMVLGFEAFPRRAQPFLDRWVDGKLTEREFIEQTNWQDYWSFDFSLYRPLFHFARLNRIPMFALNVDRELVRTVGEKGWDGLGRRQRGDIKKPAAPSLPYFHYLAAVYSKHRPEKEEKTASPAAHYQRYKDDTRFQHFVEAQTVWDRAMAQALDGAIGFDDRMLVVGIVGRGHLEYGFGIPHQLADLGITDVASLLPWKAGKHCQRFLIDNGRPVADAVFGLPERQVPEAAKKPRLGVRIQEEKDKGIRIDQVIAESIAEAAGLKKGDIITEAAGKPMRKNGDLIAVIGRQTPGTWLPLRVERSGKSIDIIAKFPPKP